MRHNSPDHVDTPILVRLLRSAGVPHKDIARWRVVCQAPDYAVIEIAYAKPNEGIMIKLAGPGAALFARIVDRDKPIPFAPELAVEVAAPSQTEEDLAAKVRLYLSGGTRLVWIVWPHDRSIDIWRAGTLDAPALRLGNHDILSGEDVVAGFTHPVADIFA